jgi:tripartite-type tricarboxylate transporter receptor subunit TctC
MEETMTRFTLAALLLAPLIALAQAYPSKPVRLIVPYAPGGATDALARPIAQKISEAFGQPVLVDNKPGANATLGTNEVARAAPDGYTFMLGSVIHYLVPMFSKNVPYDPVRDFTPIIVVANVPNLMAVTPSLPVNNAAELIEWAKKNPGKLFYGTTGVGSTHHLGGVLFAQLAGIKMEHVAYKGGNPAMADALAGQLPVVILTAPTILPHHRAGKLRAIGLIEGRRFNVVPGIAPLGESLPGYAIPDTWFGFLGPANLPRAVVERLNSEIRKAIAIPEVKERLEQLGYEVTGNTPDEFVASMNKDVAAFRKIINDAGIKPE